ncbi:MAG: cation diffusion facilitator family transporter [Acidimicrobiales bacterium]
MGHGHDHGGGKGRALWIALGLNTAYLVAEVVGGLAFGSLALLADAAHMTSDVAGLIIALVAARLALRPPSPSHSWGWVRAEVLGALANAATLLAVTAWVIVEAVRRFQHPEPIRGGPVLLIAIGGLAVNAISAVVLFRAAGRSLNIRGAFLHMAADAAGSVAVIIAAVAVLTVGADWVDPVASLAIAALVLWSTWGLLRDTLRVLLEATPAGIEPDEVTRCITDEPGVAGVHHLHLWNVSSEDAALSAHVVLTDTPSMHDAQVTGDRLKVQLHDRFGISHATLELECHACDEPDHDRAGVTGTSTGNGHGH